MRATPFHPLDDLDVVMQALESVEDLLIAGQAHDLHLVCPDNLASLLRIVRERGELELARAWRACGYTPTHEGDRDDDALQTSH